MRSHQTLGTLLLLALLPTTLLAWFITPALATVLYVPTPEYPTIQSAVNAAKAGDTIQVAAGTYPENVVVSVRQITIVGENAMTTIVDGDEKDTVFNIQANDVEIRQLTIRNGGTLYNGINIFYPYGGAVIRYNRIMDNRLGIVLSESDSNTIEGNVLINNSMYGITARDYSDSNIIKNNTISESAYGIELSDASLNQVVDNIISDTSYGVYLAYSNNNNVSANTLSSSSWNIYLAYSDSNVVGNNVASGGSVGIQIMRSQGNSVFNNTVSSSSYGIYLGHCGTNTVSGNTASLNDWGIELYNSTGSTIKENTVLDNTWGIYIAEESDGNSIYHNNFMDNVKQAYQDLTSSNTWRTSTTPYQGNYWSDYKGNDNDGDGIGDTYLPWGGVDWYPLMAPWGVHDVAITSVTVSATEVYQGETVNITVIAKNEGMPETFTVTTYANSTIIGQQTISSLAPSASETLVFTWNTSTFSTGIYIIKAEASVVPGETDTDDNTFIDGAVNVLMVIIHDVAVVSVTPSATEAYAGHTVNVSVVVRNEGTFNETFNVTLYYESTAIGTQTVTDLAPGANTTVTFSWNTTGVAPCSNYTIRAEASVVPGETDIIDNICVDGTVKVKLLGDVNGDGKVSLFDAMVVRGAYGSEPGDPNWIPEADLNRDNIIDVYDALTIRSHYGETC
jgi:nitrous oxidase accessory protein